MTALTILFCSNLQNAVSGHFLYLCTVSAKGAVLILWWAIPWEIPSLLRHASWSSQLLFLLLLPVSLADCSSMVRQCIYQVVNRGLTNDVSFSRSKGHCLDYECTGVTQRSTHAHRERAECYRKETRKRGNWCCLRFCISLSLLKKG